MPTRRTRSAISRTHGIGLIALVFAITANAALAGSSRGAREPERISVTAFSGTVSVTMAGSSTPVQLDSTVGLPARIVTGDDGMLSLTQAGTNITIAADSDVEIPAEASDGQLIARLVQRRGNVFYDVAHREVGTLRVETPFLVAVIKGTQFNVAVQEGGSTISLFQGRLEIKTPDGTDSVVINAGQIATRGNADNAIGVIGMNDKRVELPRSGDAFARGNEANDQAQGGAFELASIAVDSTRGLGASAGRSGQEVGPGVDLGAAHGAAGSLEAANLGGGAGHPNVSLGLNAALGPNMTLGPTATIESVAAIGLADNAGLHLGTAHGNGNPGSDPGLHLGNGNAGGDSGNGPGLALGNGNGIAGNPVNDPGLGLGSGNGNAGVDPGLQLGNGTPGLQLGNGNPGDNPGLHLGNGGSIGDNPGLHLGNGNGNPAAPGKSHGHP